MFHIIEQQAEKKKKEDQICERGYIPNLKSRKVNNKERWIQPYESIKFMNHEKI